MLNIRHARLMNLPVRMIVYGFISYLLGGIVFGIFICKDCEGIVGNTIGRLLVGLVMGFLSFFQFGFPPRNDSGMGDPYNVWPVILTLWLIFIVIDFYFTKKRER